MASDHDIARARLFFGGMAHYDDSVLETLDENQEEFLLQTGMARTRYLLFQERPPPHFWIHYRMVIEY